MGFSINPPNAPLVMADGRTVSPEWWRFFKEVQGTVGGPSDPFEDMAFLAPPRVPFEPAPDLLPPSPWPAIAAALADHMAAADPHTGYVREAQGAAWAAATGTEARTALASYAGQNVSNPPTEAEMQALDDAVKAISQALVALINDLRSNRALTP